MKLLEIIATPKFTLFMLALPFVLICPLSILVVVTGYPLNIILNNRSIDNYVRIFDSFKYGNTVTQIGNTIGKIGGFDAKPGKCDLVAAKLLKSTQNQNDLSQIVLNARAKITNDPSEVPHFDLVAQNEIKLIPITPETTEFRDGALFFDIHKDFGVSSFNLSPGELPYILYMFSNNVFESTDWRCAEKVVKAEDVNVEVD